MPPYRTKLFARMCSLCHPAGTNVVQPAAMSRELILQKLVPGLGAIVSLLMYAGERGTEAGSGVKRWGPSADVRSCVCTRISAHAAPVKAVMKAERSKSLGVSQRLGAGRTTLGAINTQIDARLAERLHQTCHRTPAGSQRRPARGHYRQLHCMAHLWAAPTRPLHHDPQHSRGEQRLYLVMSDAASTACCCCSA